MYTNCQYPIFEGGNATIETDTLADFPTVDTEIEAETPVEFSHLVDEFHGIESEILKKA